ncbi:MAG: TIR domain-containing protein, partial [Verrucomicrobiota bacterium]
RHDEENPRQAELPLHILEQIQSSGTMIVVCSPHTSVSRWIRAEVEAFYSAHPRGRIIPLVMSGEPEPEATVQAYVKPCLPENLNRTDAEYWVDARECEWKYAAPAAAISALLGVRIEELVQHISLRARSMGVQRTLSGLAAVFVALLAGMWTWRQPVHEWSLANFPGYSESLSSLVEPWLEGSDESIHEISTDHARSSIPPGPVPLTDSIPNHELTPTSASSAKAEPVPVPVESADAAQVALSAWLDRAESYLPDQLRDANFWLDTCEAKLSLFEEKELGHERYRFHALRAAIAQSSGEKDAAAEHLLTAIEHWTSIPVENPVGQEREAFEILATVSPNAAWRESALRLVIWISQLKGDSNRIMIRAENFIAFATRFPFLYEPVDAWLSGAYSRIEPSPENPLEIAGQMIVLRSRLAEQAGMLIEARKQLQDGRIQLAKSGKPSPIIQALIAQMGVRQVQFLEKLNSEALARELDSALPVLQSGMTNERWSDWFGPDLAMAWTLRGDLYLSEDVFETAAQAYSFALEYIPSESRLGEVLLKIGCAYRYSDMHQEAWEAFSMAQTMLKEDSSVKLRITAFLGSSMAARKVKTREEAKGYLDRANTLITQKAPDFRPPSFWREPLDTVMNLQTSATVSSAERDAEIERLRARIQHLENIAGRKSVDQLRELQGLYLALDRLYRENKG